MIDRTELDLRLAAHTRHTNMINGQGWKRVATVPAPAPRAALAAVLLRMATRLDPARVGQGGASGQQLHQAQA